MWPPRIMSFEETVPLMQQYWLPFVSAALYVLMVHLLPVILRPVYKSSNFYRTFFVKGLLRTIMVLWNAFLSVASAIMFYNVLVPVLTEFLPHYDYSFSKVVCDVDNIAFTNGRPHQYWVWIFVLSKLAELFDTLFLILKNPTRPVEFLHWYHHTTVLLFCWFAWYFQFSAAVHFMVMNAFIHTFMYCYYGLKELGFNPSWNKILTMAQIAQMLGGCVLVGTHTYQHLVAKQNCTVRQPEIIVSSALVMYASYLALFMAFFFKRYDPKSKKNMKTNASSPSNSKDKDI